MTILENTRVIAFVIAVLFCIIFIRGVWRRLWKLPIIGNFLSEKVFPDLNGQWEIKIHSNWTLIDTMRKAALDPDLMRIDVLTDQKKLPKAKVVKLQGELTQNWQQSTFIIEPSKDTPLRTSRTISLELIKATNDHPKRIAWIFRQENNDVDATDEDNFLGAALLNVENNDKLSGKFWNNRQWRKGLNAAGEIVMTRQH